MSADAGLGKLSPSLRARLRRPRGAEARVRVVVRFRGGQEQLRALGLSLGSIAGDLATADVALDDLPAIARAPEIVYVEGGGALWPDPGTPDEVGPLDGG